MIITYGGDGTINEVVQGMAHSNAALAVWPGGTSNVTAVELGMPFTLERLADVFAAGKTRRVALGRAGIEARGEGPEAASRYFLMMAGIGLDASIARSVNKDLKRRVGELAYWVSGIKHLFTWPADRFTITVDGKKFESAFTIIGNGKGYGGGMVMTPHARLDEPLFEVYILPPQKSMMAYLQVLAACMRGKPETTGAAMIKGRKVEANSSHTPLVETDGEVIGPLPMTFEAVPDALTLIVP
jgi:diacylglycerol kinase (ATP)